MAVAAVYLCMVVLNLGPLFGYTTHLAPLISISTPSEDWGPAPKAKGIAAEIHASPAGIRRGKLAEQLALPEDCGSAPMASSLATENHKPTASSVCSTVNNCTEGDCSSS
ncbi:hypothetical protein NQZ68_028798 [Dissostichus eleginoides]|nr:hypothetical protein NQZ68_028798 [Dissostichus eleginoides]